MIFARIAAIVRSMFVFVHPVHRLFQRLRGCLEVAERHSVREGNADPLSHFHRPPHSHVLKVQIDPDELGIGDWPCK